MGSVHHLGNFIPNLPQLCHPHTSTSKKDTHLFELLNMKKFLIRLKKKLPKQQKIVILIPLQKHEINAMPSEKGLGCALEQRTPDGWHAVAFGLHFLNTAEERYSINEIEFLGVV